MSEENRAFCSVMLKLARDEAREKNVKIPKLVTWRDDYGVNTYFEVWAGSEIIWSGDAHYATEAKANAIHKLIERQHPEE